MPAPHPGRASSGIYMGYAAPGRLLAGQGSRSECVRLRNGDHL